MPSNNPIPKHLLQFPWYAGHMAWLESTEGSSKHDAPPGTKPEKAFIRDATFENANLKGACLRKADFEGSRFRFAGLEGVDFREASLKGCDFSHAILKGARFRCAGMWNTVFWDADCSYASFAGADARSAEMRYGIFLGCDFSDADLRDVDFEESSFEDAWFKGADLTGAKNTRSLPQKTLRKQKPACAHKWAYVPDDSGAWVKICSLCSEKLAVKSSEGKTADGKPFVILMME